MRVAAHLGIPFTTLDASVEYKQGVIDYLLAEYKAGRTPNPDIMCNKEVKFGAFYRFAQANGADYIATGHYAQVIRDEGGVHLIRGIDADKDQSYFLWAVPKGALAQTLFPLGSQAKRETRRLAQQFRLPVATKRDSQGICFLGSVSVEDFLESEFGTEPGIATDAQGASVGEHNGALLHTIGERISLNGAAAGPWYVLAKDIEKNVLVVGKERGNAAVPAEIVLRDMNWFAEVTPEDEIVAQYRYHGPKVSGRISEQRFAPTEALPEPVAQGQSLVIYRGEECVGGGIIA
jgi:tRNA-uridine 2-sulfurtransferase